MSNTADVLGMKRVGVVCEICMCLARGGVGGEAGEWIRELGLDFTNPVGIVVMLYVCLCLGCGSVNDVCGEWVGDWTRVWKGGVLLCLCEL